MVTSRDAVERMMMLVEKLVAKYKLCDDDNYWLQWDEIVDILEEISDVMGEYPKEFSIRKYQKKYHLALDPCLCNGYVKQAKAQAAKFLNELKKSF